MNCLLYAPVTKHVLVRWFTWMARVSGFCFLGTCVLVFTGCSKQASSSPERYLVNLRCMRNGAHIFVFKQENDTIPRIDTYSLKVEDELGSHDLRNFADLQGKVSIHTGEDALEFVRLRTSFWSYYLWPEDRTIEVVSSSMLPKLPSYGLEQIHNPYRTAGVINDTDFIKSGFSVPQVVTNHGQYNITRWLLDLNLTGTPFVEKVGETVTSDGRYSITVLAKKNVPRLSNSQWGIPSQLF